MLLAKGLFDHGEHDGVLEFIDLAIPVRIGGMPSNASRSRSSADGEVEGARLEAV